MQERMSGKRTGAIYPPLLHKKIEKYIKEGEIKCEVRPLQQV